MLRAMVSAPEAETSSTYASLWTDTSHLHGGAERGEVLTDGVIGLFNPTGEILRKAELLPQGHSLADSVRLGARPAGDAGGHLGRWAAHGATQVQTGVGDRQPGGLHRRRKCAGGRCMLRGQLDRGPRAIFSHEISSGVHVRAGSAISKSDAERRPHCRRPM